MYMGHEIGCIYEHRGRGGGSPSIHSQRYTYTTHWGAYVVHTPQKYDGLLYCFSLSHIQLGN